MGKLRNPMRATCELCGAEYDRWYTNQRFCTRECQKRYKRAYMRGYNKRYRAEHGDALRAYGREFYRAHHDTMLKKAAMYRARRKEADMGKPIGARK